MTTHDDDKATARPSAEELQMMPPPLALDELPTVKIAVVVLPVENDE